MVPQSVIYIFMAANCGLLGFATFYWAAPLSASYTAWTFNLRERYFRTKPQTPDVRRRQTQFVMWVLRILGASLIVDSIVMLIALWKLI